MTHVCLDVDDCIAKIRKFKKEKAAVSLAYCGNVVELWCVFMFS